MQVQQLQKRLPLIIAVVCGVWAIFLLNGYIKRREAEIFERIRQTQRQPAQQAAQMAVVLVAQKDIPEQVPITPADLMIREMPAEYIQPGTVTSLEEVIGQIPSAPIAAGEQILKSKLLPPNPKYGKSLSEITPAGKRAVSVPVDNITSISALVRPGNFVDVLAMIAMPQMAAAKGTAKTNEPRLISLFQNIEVLAVGGEYSPGPVSREQAKPPTSNSVTLALTPQEGVLLSFVQEHGKIKLALRSAQDNKEETVKPADWDTLFQHLYPVQGGADGKQPMVEIYRGLEKEVVPLSER